MDTFWSLFGCLLGPFWSPFGCVLGALGTSFEDFASTLAALEMFVGLWAFGESLARFFNTFVNNLKMCFPVNICLCVFCMCFGVFVWILVSSGGSRGLLFSNLFKEFR